MKNILFALMLVASVAFADYNPDTNTPLIYSNPYAKMVKSQPGLCFGDSACVISGSLNPTSSAVDAPMGSVYLSTSGTGYLKNDSGLSTNWSALSTGGVNSVSGTAPIISSGGSTPAISMPPSTNSVDGYLSAADHTSFAAKQAAGNYLTGTSGDVVSSGPGVGSSVVATAAYKRYINFVLGDDSLGTGSELKPWKTVQHACTAVTGLATVNTPFTIFVSGGNNDTDSGAVSCPPNINIIADYPIQITGSSFTITGGITNDSVSFTNLIFIGAFSWIRNDATAMGIQFRNAEFFSGPTVKQNGAGSASITAYDSVSVNADFKTGGVGSFFFNHNFLGSTTTFEDANSSAYYQLMGGYNSSNISVSGGAEIYLSGLQCDAPFGCAMTGATTANGTPVIQTDSGSVPASIAGAFSTNLISHSQYESYAPSVSTNWASAPSTVKAALDNVAAAKPLNAYRVDKSGHDSATCGAELNPCLTISQALTNIGVSATAADVKNAKTVIIGAGAYDESLTIPSGRIISLLAQGMVVLGDGAGANWASTTPRSIAWNPQAADLHGSDVKPALTIGTLAPADATSTFIAESQNFTISGNLTMNGDGTTKTLNLHGVKVWGNISHTDASLVNLQSYRSLVVGTVSTTGNLVLERAYDSRFNGLLSVNAINMAFNSSFLGGITVQSIQQNLLPNGIFHCNIAGAFTGVASSARFDAATYQYFRSNGATLAGGATIALISDSVLSQSASGSQPACVANLRGLQWLVQGGAGVADIYQVCQKNSSDAYVWTTH